MQKRPESDDFLIRWLNGNLTETELASLRNREEYEEMITVERASSPVFAEQKQEHSPHRFAPEKTCSKSNDVSNPGRLPTFLALAVFALLATLFFAKSSGWF